MERGGLQARAPSERATGGGSKGVPLAALTARRKAIYEELHPETVSVTKRGGPGRGNKNDRQAGDSFAGSDRFTSETAKKTGRSERAVQRDAEGGKNVIPGAGVGLGGRCRGHELPVHHFNGKSVRSCNVAGVEEVTAPIS